MNLWLNYCHFFIYSCNTRHLESSLPLQIIVPYTNWDFDSISALGASCCLLKSSKGLGLKGGFKATQLPGGGKGLLFAGSPRVTDLNELEVGYAVTVPLPLLLPLLRGSLTQAS